MALKLHKLQVCLPMQVMLLNYRTLNPYSSYCCWKRFSFMFKGTAAGPLLSLSVEEYADHCLQTKSNNRQL